MCEKSRSLTLCALAVTVALGSASRGALVGYWKLDETSGTVAADSSGNGINGVLQGAAAIVNDAERGPVFQQNDVVANYISIADPGGRLNFSGTGPHQGSATVVAWVKSNGNWTNHDTIFSQGEWDNGIGLSIKGDTSPAGQLWLAGDGTHAVAFRSDVGVPTVGWHHVAATFAYDGTTTVVTFYLDGVPTGFAQGDGRLPGRVTAPVGGVSRIGLEDRSGTGSSPRWPFNGSIDDVAAFDTALSQAEIQAVMQGIGTQQGEASHPNPADGAEDVIRDVVLSWSAGDFAATHNVYLGTSAADVEAATLDSPLTTWTSAGQDANTFDPPGRLEFGRTFYWRVDEVNAAPDATVVTGPVWSFTVEPALYPIRNITATASSAGEEMGPEKTIDGSGLDPADQHSTDPTAMWLTAADATGPAWIQYEFDKAYKLEQLLLWNYNQMLESVYGFGAKRVTVEYSLDGLVWTPGGAVELARAPGKATCTAQAVELGGIVARYVKLTFESNWGGLLSGLSEVRFSYLPVRAHKPLPASGQTDVAVDATLSWRSGREAAAHQVYFGTDSNAVAEGTAPAHMVGETSFVPGPLDLATTYYWKVTEVNEAETPAAWPGDTWSFTTRESFVIDDFESYNDEDESQGMRIYQTWIDGYADSSSGSIVGNWDPPFAERMIVHGGRQSLPLDYNNVNAPYYSEAYREFSPAQDWTTHGISHLVLWLRGNPVAFATTPGGTISLSAWGTDIFGTADQGRFAYKSLSGNGTIVARIESIGNSDLWAKGGVMIRESLDPGSRYAFVFAAPGNGVRFQARPITGVTATSDTPVATPEQIALQTPVWVKLERSGMNFSGFYSTDGVNWTAMSWNPQAINMVAPTIFIGLAATSHNVNIPTTAVFSGVTTSAGVSGSWQVAAIGAAHPANSTQGLYLTVQDSAGQTATVAHPDPAAVNITAWTEWKIPLNDFAGVNLARVKRMFIGVGDKTNAQPDGAGKLYFDDILLTKPVSP